MTQATIETTATEATSTEVKMTHYFWDIESYENLFLVGLLSDANHFELHYLTNSPQDDDIVVRAAHAYAKMKGYTLSLYDLKEDATVLKQHFEQHVPALQHDTLLSNFLGIEGQAKKPKTGIYFAFNSLHYDICMIDYVLKSIVAGRVRLTPQALRRHSDAIINGTAPAVDTLAYEEYANQVDLAYLDDSFTDGSQLLIGLKTLIGMMGGSIIESESNKSGVSKDLYGDVFYNGNDIDQMRDVTFKGTKLESTYNIRKTLLSEYEDRLKPNHITVNRSSAKFVENIIAPETPIVDAPVVSFLYPAAHVAKEKGVEQFDVLEYTKDWYDRNVLAPVRQHNPKQAAYLEGKFFSIYRFYKNIEGKNWNDSGRHLARYNIPAQPKEERRQLMEIFGTYLPLVDKYGKDSDTYVNFSLGGIHGAEINRQQLDQDRQIVADLKAKYGSLDLIPRKAVSLKLLNLLKKQSLEAPTHLAHVPKRLLHEIPHYAKQCRPSNQIPDPEDIGPFGLQTVKKKTTETLLDRYKYISSAQTIHQDFAGYYPLLLINLGVFYDGNGVDPYREVYDKRIHIKSLLKTLLFKSPEWIVANNTQEGYKLILNSASGILDGSFDTKCRANNKALAMRIIGQLFTFIIAQALALEGAKVPSSNTDGIYVTDIEEALNKEIVDRELSKLLVSIDPEPVFLVSKDTNNRLEMHEGEVLSARGGTLTSHEGPRIDKRLSHPALCDAVMVNYLSNTGVVNRQVDTQLMQDAYRQFLGSVSKRDFLLMAGWLLRPTSGSLFIETDPSGQKAARKGTLRAFLTQSGSDLARANTVKKNPSISFDQMVNQLPPEAPAGEPELVRTLASLGALDHWPNLLTVAGYNQVAQVGVPNKERDCPSVPLLSTAKISGLDPRRKVTLDNRSLIDLSDDQVDQLFANIDHFGYLDMCLETAKLWQNQLIA